MRGHDAPPAAQTLPLRKEVWAGRPQRARYPAGTSKMTPNACLQAPGTTRCLQKGVCKPVSMGACRHEGTSGRNPSIGSGRRRTRLGGCRRNLIVCTTSKAVSAGTCANGTEKDQMLELSHRHRRQLRALEVGRVCWSQPQKQEAPSLGTVRSRRAPGVDAQDLDAQDLARLQVGQHWVARCYLGSAAILCTRQRGAAPRQKKIK